MLRFCRLASHKNNLIIDDFYGVDRALVSSFCTQSSVSQIPHIGLLCSANTLFSCLILSSSLWLRLLSSNLRLRLLSRANGSPLIGEFCILPQHSYSPHHQKKDALASIRAHPFSLKQKKMRSSEVIRLTREHLPQS